MSRTAEKNVCERMLSDFGYDMYFHIPDLPRFFQEMRSSESKLRYGTVGDVEYEDFSPLDFDKEYRMDLFRKRRAYAWQEEIRCVWGGDAPLEPFMIECPGILDMISIQQNPFA